MKIVVCKDYEEMSQKGKDFIISELKRDSSLALGGATGNTPKRLYELLAQSGFDFSERKIWFLDEYFGKMSYYQYAVNFLHNNFPQGRGFRLENIHIPQGIFYWNNQTAHSETLSQILLENKNDYHMLGPEVSIYAEAMNGLLKQIRRSNRNYEHSLPVNRLQILGIGVEGHVGFNEKGTRKTSLTHLTLLDESTLTANESDFADGIRTKYALTQGIQSIMRAKYAVLFASGEKKAEAVHGFLLGDNSASALRNHENLAVFLTRDILARFTDKDKIKLRHSYFIVDFAT